MVVKGCHRPEIFLESDPITTDLSRFSTGSKVRVSANLNALAIVPIIALKIQSALLRLNFTQVSFEPETLSKKLGTICTSLVCVFSTSYLKMSSTEPVEGASAVEPPHEATDGQMSTRKSYRYIFRILFGRMLSLTWIPDGSIAKSWSPSRKKCERATLFSKKNIDSWTFHYASLNRPST